MKYKRMGMSEQHITACVYLTNGCNPLNLSCAAGNLLFSSEYEVYYTLPKAKVFR